MHRDYSLTRTARASVAFATAVACMLGPGLCCGVEITLDAAAVGYVRRVPGATIKHYPAEGYLTGSQGNGILHTDHNSYFIFDLSSVSGFVAGAEFRVYTSDERGDVPEGGYWSTSASEQLLLYEFSGDPTTLMNYSATQYNSGSSQYNELHSMFTDLGDGALFGSTVMTEAAAEAQPGVVPGQPGGKVWQVPLTGSAVASLNSTSALWALGGSLADVAPPISSTTELLFKGSMPFSAIPGRATPIPQLVLTVVPEPSADFDGDDDVDGADFLIWQRHVGAGGQTNNANGDASGNGIVGGEDLLHWKSQFGGAAIAASVSVPEPRSAMMVLVLAAANVLWRLRRRACGAATGGRSFFLWINNRRPMPAFLVDSTKRR